MAPQQRLAHLRWALAGGGRASAAVPAAAAEEEPRFVTLDNGGLRVSVRLMGGGINSVTPSGSEDKNPLTAGAGHFICCDRWGPASRAEQANGMTWHGEASRSLWEVASASATEAELTVALPMAGLTVTRRLTLLGDQPMVLVEEGITNTNPLGRVWNVVQHPTLGPPFLDWDTVVDSNATTGFAQAPRVAPGEDNVQLPVSAAERQYFTFPETTNQAGTATQLRTMEGAQEDDVASYIIPDGVSHGWCTATSAKDGLIFGYVWPTEDYPWLSLYRSVVDGKVAA